MILLENLRFHIEEEGKGVDKDGKKVKNSFHVYFYGGGREAGENRSGSAKKKEEEEDTYLKKGFLRLGH